MSESSTPTSTPSKPIGKFDCAESLLKAYDSLLSEFIKRCQRLKETEKEIGELKSAAEDKTKQAETAKNALRDENFVKDHILSDEEIFTRVIEKYLDGLTAVPAPRLLSGGAAALSPPSLPKDLAEAKRLADIMLHS